MEFLVSKGCTPAERFWATSAVSATARSNAIGPLLGQVSAGNVPSRFSDHG
jgi:hypothetical protein